MSGINPIERLNLNNYNPFGLPNDSMSAPPSLSGMGFKNSAFGSFDSFNQSGIMAPNYGDMFAQNLQQNAWSAILGFLANYKPPQIDLSQFDFGQANMNGVNINMPNSSGAGGSNYDATKKFEGAAADLDKTLGSGVLKGKGAKLLELQEKYGVSASVLAAIVCTESGYGKSNAATSKNNVAGIMSAESNYMKLASFDSVDDCLEALAKNLKKNYIDKGLTTISQIHGKYCPVGAANDPTGMNKNWGSVVAQITDKIEGNMA